MTLKAGLSIARERPVKLQTDWIDIQVIIAVTGSPSSICVPGGYRGGALRDVTQNGCEGD